MNFISSFIFQLLCCQVFLAQSADALPPLIDGPDDTTVQLGKQTLLDCVFSEDPGTIIAWIKEGLALVIDGIIYDYDGDTNAGNYSLTIINATLENDGLYRCGYIGSETENGLISNFSRVTVLVQPDNPIIVNYTNGEDLIIQGDDNIISCIVEDGNPEAHVSWFIGFTELEGKASIANGSMEPLKTVTNQLILNASMEYHNKKLYCAATHPSNENITSTFVILKISISVTTVYATFEGTSQSNVSFPEGSNISMFCISDGFPEPSYMWSRDNQTFANEQNITIQAEEGTYICAALNAESSYVFSNELIVHVVVSENVTILENPKNSTANKEENLILNCTFSGLVDSCNWYKDGNYFMPGSNGYVNIGNEEIGDCTLLIQDIQLQHEGIYFCEANGVISEKATVTVFQAPKAPVFLLNGDELSENLFLPKGTWPISCKSEDGKPGAYMTIMQNKCFEEVSEVSEISTENPKLTTVTSTVNVTLDETSSTVQLICISRHPAIPGGVSSSSLLVKVFGAVYRATASIVNHPRKSVQVPKGEMLDMICYSDSPFMTDYLWEIKENSNNQWKFIKSGPSLYMKAAAGTFRCQAGNRFNNGNFAISNEIFVLVK